MPALCLHLLSGVISTHSYCPWCGVPKGHGLQPAFCVTLVFPSLPLAKVMFHTLHLLFTKHLLSAFSVPGSVNAEMNKTHACAQGTPGAQETAQQTAVPFVSLGPGPRGLVPKDSTLPLPPSLKVEPFHALLPFS